MLYDFTARMHEDDIVYIHQRAQRAGIALKTKYSPLVDINCTLSSECSFKVIHTTDISIETVSRDGWHY